MERENAESALREGAVKQGGVKQLWGRQFSPEVKEAFEKAQEILGAEKETDALRSS